MEAVVEREYGTSTVSSTISTYYSDNIFNIDPMNSHYHL